MTDQEEPLISTENPTNGRATSDPQADNYQDMDLYTYTENKPVSFMTRIFYFLCILSGLYIHPHVNQPPNPKPALPGSASPLYVICSYMMILLFLILNILLNLFSVGFDLFAIISCDLSEYCGFIYTLPAMRNLSTASNVTHGLALQPPSLTQFDDWQKAVITTATISGALSYFFMAWALYGRYSVLSRCYNPNTNCVSAIVEKSNCCQPQHHKEAAQRNLNVLIVNPFYDKGYKVREIMDKEIEVDKDCPIENQFLSSLITPKQCIYFQFIFWLNLGFFATSVAIFVVILCRRLSLYDPVFTAIDSVGLFAQFASQFSALMSCFIFSKAAYAVSNQCLDFTRIFQHVAHKPIAENGNYLKNLKIMDRKYVLLLQNSLGPFGTWFAIHWVFYTVTAFMAIAYVADQIIMELYGSEPSEKKCHGEHDLDCRLNLIYSIFFALQHCILFLYPCYRAASLTKARSNMIKYISNADWPDVPVQDKNAFVTYLKEQVASFKISVFCAELPFGFNMAFISIFIGVLGVVMKLCF